jgi:hypothetical protein
VLALSVVRLVAFASGGLFGLVLGQALAPSWGQPLMAFLVGGLAAHLLFRLWVMALASFCGTLLMAYTGLCLADRLGKLNAVDWTEKRTVLLNWLCGGVAVLGLVVQLFLERRLGGKKNKKGKDGGSKGKDKEKKEEKSDDNPPSVWSWGQALFRKAG